MYIDISFFWERGGASVNLTTSMMGWIWCFFVQTLTFWGVIMMLYLIPLLEGVLWIRLHSPTPLK